MKEPPLPGRDAVLSRADALSDLISCLHRRGYQVVAPVLRDGAICYGAVSDASRLPSGWTAEQGPGSFRLKPRSDHAHFGYASLANSLKPHLHAADVCLFSAERLDRNGRFRILSQAPPEQRLAFLGVRACDLAAVAIQDDILMGGNGRPVDEHYQCRRRNALLIAVHCTEPGSTCFCASMGTGPRARSGFDLALTEWVDHGQPMYYVEIGTDAGADVLSELPHEPASADIRLRVQRALEAAACRMGRQMETAGLRDRLYGNLDHPRWDQVAQRCLTCGNCTQVCPTCFCITVEDTSDVTGRHAERHRRWDSCFTSSFSYIHGGSVRLSAKSRYRQWLTHKLAGWQDQFGTCGCVGCGRCITWCPVGIDLTEEVAALSAPAPSTPSLSQSPGSLK